MGASCTTSVKISSAHPIGIPWLQLEPRFNLSAQFSSGMECEGMSVFHDHDPGRIFMAEPVRREDAVQILRKLDESRIHLKKGHLQGCLHVFKDALERTLRTQMLPADEKMVREAVNVLQQEIAASRAFLEQFGPVSFRDGEIRTTLDFVRQLLQLQADEMSTSLTTRQDSDAPDGEETLSLDTAEQKARDALAMAGSEGESRAREFLGDDEETLALILQMCNTAGIEYRKAGLFDRAIAEFRKALVFHPGDEGLHYNIARAFLEKKDWSQAERSIREGLKANPDFQEGKNLLAYIRSQASGPGS